MITSTPEAYQLLHDGSLTLSQMEENGIRVDVDYLDRTTRRIGTKIKLLEEELKNDDIYKTWRKIYGVKTRLGSKEQLARIIFKEMGYPSNRKTKGGKREASDEEAFLHVDLPFVKTYFKNEKLKKAKGTYLNGIKRETVDGFLHPIVNLHTVITIRSSCDTPNFQNIPIRNPEIGKLIRRCFIPRQGRVFVERDFSALEFKIAACFWKDPEMVKYASDPEKDVHRDMAAECYKCSTKEVNKDLRFYAKNQFVFPILYGSYWKKCAQRLWNCISEANLQIDGISVYQWLAKKGINELGDADPRDGPVKGTFEYHVKKVEERFNQRFEVFSRSKDKWWNSYQMNGQFQTPTGFLLSGIYSKNFLMNAPIQGSAFHCLLKGLIFLQKKITQKAMRSLLVAQIHDCSLGDVPEDEIQEYLDLSEKVMTEDVRKAWNWVIVPLGIEAEVTSVGGSWHDKKQWVKKDGIWQEKL